MDKAALLEAQESLIALALTGAEDNALLRGLCEWLVAAGVPLWRVVVALEELHPLVEGRGMTWRRAEAETTYRPYERADWANRQDEWERSPFYRVYADKAPRIRRRRGDYQQGEFPLLDDLFAQGAWDYVAYHVPFVDAARASDTDSLFVSWTTDRDGGFSDGDVEALDHIVPTLALALRNRAIVRNAGNLVRVYLGEDAGRRVLNGQIERGQTVRMHAVLWFSDLAGFTRITDTAPAEQIVPLLNDYAECQVGAIHANGGQVLKFVGDGMLAIFRSDGDVRAACRRALAAADAALERLAALNRRRNEQGLPVTKFYLALHIGEVLYGNIGSNERLDFTVVGPAVNEVSRIEAMCRSIDRDVVLSAEFARAAAGGESRLVSLGRYALRGVRQPQELFTLDLDLDRPA